MTTTSTILSPPTSTLPPIRNVASHPIHLLENAINYLRAIYNPEVRGSRRRRGSHPARIQVHSSERQNQHTTLLSLRADAFERSYSIKWLTALISNLTTSSWEPTTPDDPEIERDRREALIDRAASLLAISAGTASAGVITREFSFPLPHDAKWSGDGQPADISVSLTDVPLDNQDYGSVGAQTWGGACVLAEAIVENPRQYGLLRSANATLRILELGAGTGLVSLTIAKLLQTWRMAASEVDVEIVATDYYARVLDNLRSNIRTNFPSQTPAALSPEITISCHPLDWSSFHPTPPIGTTLLQPPLDRTFDVVFGADIIYETDHAVWIKSVLSALLKKPPREPAEDSGDRWRTGPLFHLVIPLRKTHTAESGSVERVFKSFSGRVPGEGHKEGEKEGVDELVIYEKTFMVCDAMEDGSEEVQYVYYQIGWQIG